MVINSPVAEYIVAVFRSRQHALAFADAAREHGIKCSIISTPKELSLGCGFSVKMDEWALARAKGLRELGYSNGVYRFTIKNGVSRHTLISD